MKNSIKFGLLTLILPAAVMLQSCEDGTFEEAGEELDQVSNSATDAARDAGNRVEDACEELTETNC